MDVTIGGMIEPPPGDRDVEVVERKGRAPPDTICDGMAERQLLEVRLRTEADSRAEDFRSRVEEVSDEELGRLEDLWREILEGEVGVALF